jgi:hypothetical protein
MNEALFGQDKPLDMTADTTTDATPDLQMLPVDELHPDESQPRTEMEGLDHRACNFCALHLQLAPALK